MKRILSILLLVLPPVCAEEKGWTSLFNGKDFTGWKVSENPGSFTIKDGALIANGPRAHCFYVGEFQNHTFKDYELMVDVMTQPGANGGIFIDTEYQESGWPLKGFEVQVNNSSPREKRLTASLYKVKDNLAAVAKDNQWFTEHIVVKGDTVTISVDGKQVTQWTQPADWNGTDDFPLRRVAPGTIALQGHDPTSIVYYKNIRIRPLK